MDYPRIGYDLILHHIAPGSRVLDLGCGDGMLLERLQEERDVEGFGVEISSEGVSQCVEKGLYCYQGDIDDGLSDYRDNSFDYVILNQTLQSTKRPGLVIRETMRIARNAIISFPNFSHRSIRFHISLRGTMPVNKLLPYEWYNTPNIHLLTIKDFHSFCVQHGYPIRKEAHFSANGTWQSRRARFFPNLTAEYGFFILDGTPFTTGTGTHEG